MAILTFPNIKPQQVRWGLRSHTRYFESPLNRSVQTVESPGAQWVATLKYTVLNRTDAATMRSFLVQLRGMNGRFYLHDHSMETPLGNPSGSPVVNGAGQTGNTLNTTGWSASTTGLLLPGDYIGIGSGTTTELKLVTQQVDSDASGNATITFEPPIRTSPGDATSVVYNKPTAIMRVVNDEEIMWDVIPGDLYSLTLECIEAFYV